MATPIGPLMISLAGISLSDEERDLLQRRAVGGVIFFSRNFNNKGQLSNLVSEIKEIDPSVFLAVDHEGGAVQRFRNGFTRLPPMQAFGILHDRNPQRALRLAQATGRLVAQELREVGIDTGFSPVLDLRGASEVIGKRALHHDPDVVAHLGEAFIRGLQTGGAAGGILPVGKHFPGHGTAKGDTHRAVVSDDRPLEEIRRTDLKAFGDLVAGGRLRAVMTAHVVYPQVDALPVSRSRRWLGEILRGALGFDGVVFSDDLSMRGVRPAAGKITAKPLLEAGCDMVLICHDLQLLRDSLAELSDEEVGRYAETLGERLEQALGKPVGDFDQEDFDADAVRTELQKLNHD